MKSICFLIKEEEEEEERRVKDLMTQEPLVMGPLQKQ